MVTAADSMSKLVATPTLPPAARSLRHIDHVSPQDAQWLAAPVVSTAHRCTGHGLGISSGDYGRGRRRRPGHRRRGRLAWYCPANVPHGPVGPDVVDPDSDVPARWCRRPHAPIARPRSPGARWIDVAEFRYPAVRYPGHAEGRAGLTNRLSRPRRDRPGRLGRRLLARSVPSSAHWDGDCVDQCRPPVEV